MEVRDLLEIIGKLRAAGREFKTIDAKQELKLQENGEKAEFVKDVAAMANNVMKSYIVIGLQDGTFADIGRLSRHFLKNDLNQFLADKIDPPVVVDYQEYIITGTEYGLIEVIGYNPPYIIARDLVANRTDQKQIRIYKGTIFVRHEDRTVGVSRTELEGLLQAQGIKKEFANETEYAQQLIFERPRSWEYLLTAELLRSKLIPIKQKLTEMKKGLIYKKTVPIQAIEFLTWAGAECDNVNNLATTLAKVFNEELPIALRPPGVSGDPLEIKRAIEIAISACNELVERETDIHFAVAAAPFQALKQKMEGWTEEMLEQIDTIPEKLTDVFLKPHAPGEYGIKIVLRVSPRIAEFSAEIQRLKSHPEELAKMYRKGF